MAFIERERRNELPVKHGGMLASNRGLFERKPELVKFYEFEAAIILDVVLDETHPILADKTIIANDYHENLDGTPPKKEDTNYGWIGCVKFRFINTDRGVLNEQLRWAMPLENTGVTEIPLINEVVAVVEYFGNFFYTRKLNLTGFPNSSAMFSLEPFYGVPGESVRESCVPTDEYSGPDSKLNLTPQGSGKLGKIFQFNSAVRSLKRYEGDTIIESRFGSSIRFGTYGPDKATNEAASGYENYSEGKGNPWLLIRNRQADIDKGNKVTNHPKTYVTESVNNDGSSIQLTSGKTISEFKTTCKKVMLQDGQPEEQPKFSPAGITDFKYPTLSGDQIVINSDRLVFQARGQEFIQYAKKRFAIVTDSEYTVDAHDQIVLTTNCAASINAPFIFLGEAYQMAEPALLGRTTSYWMHQLCTWLLNQTNWMIELCNEWHSKHKHSETGSPPAPTWVKKMKEHVKALEILRTELIALRKEIPKNMSQRVFLVGGGGAPGFPGGDLSSGTSAPDGRGIGPGPGSYGEPPSDSNQSPINETYSDIA